MKYPKPFAQKAKHMKLIWPDGRSFAFTICDDTDNGTVDNLKPVYDALVSNGLLTTKTVWSLPCPPSDKFYGETLSDDPYLRWVVDLSRRGVEIGWHGARSGGSTRSEIIKALDLFRETFGAWPSTYANHASNIENIFWGKERFDNPLLRAAYGRSRRGADFQGSTPGTPYYWLDICSERLRYVRDFTFREIVTSAVDPWMPYHDSRRRQVHAWFSSSDAADVEKFVQLVTPQNLDRLEKSGGLCILYTHFASGFAPNGRLDQRVERILRELGSRNGWFAPVTSILTYLEDLRGVHELKPSERARLEWRWAKEHLSAVPRRLFGARAR